MKREKVILLLENGMNVTVPDVWDKIKDAPINVATNKSRIGYSTKKLIPVYVTIVCVIAISFASLHFYHIHNTIYVINKDSEGKSMTSKEEKTQISINELNAAPINNSFNINLNSKDFIAMTISQLSSYYGTNIIPTFIPKGLMETTEKDGVGEVLGIYKRNNGTGEVYWGQNSLMWTNTQHSYYYDESLSVTVSKGNLPFYQFETPTGTLVPSVVNGVDVNISHYNSEKDHYCAQFIYNNTGFEVDTQNVSQGDFIYIIKSLIN